MGRWDRVLTFSSLCLSQEKGTEGSGLLLPFGNSFFICALYDYKADESALINTALNWTIVGPFTGFGKAGAHEMWGFWWCHGEGSSLQVCRANTMAVLSFTRKGLLPLFGSGQSFKLSSTSHGDSSSVGKLCCHKDPLQADSLAFQYWF